MMKTMTFSPEDVEFITTDEQREAFVKWDADFDKMGDKDS